jgi:hypothetical protein
MVKNFLPETLTLPLPLAVSVSKPKLSRTVKFYQNHFHKEKTGKKESSHEMQAWKKSKGSRYNLKSNQHTGCLYTLAFLLRMAGAELAYLCLLFLWFDCNWLINRHVAGHNPNCPFFYNTLIRYLDLRKKFSPRVEFLRSRDYLYHITNKKYED